LSEKPPQTLDRHLEVDPKIWEPTDINFVLTGLVVPRPIGWVSTLSPEGVANLSPFSFFTVAANDPPHVLFSISPTTKDTLANARETGEFVVNIAHRALLDQLVESSAAVRPETDEFQLVGLDTSASARVKPPRVAAARAHFECVTRQLVPVGQSMLVIGEIVHLHIAPEVWREGRVRPDLLDPVGRLGGSLYGALGEIISRPAPSINER
jgi:flavin reductase (DIM6/NTAB) family NADH-FMN oxidoreductase RutF